MKMRSAAPCTPHPAADLSGRKPFDGKKPSFFDRFVSAER
jgi:hypothetical protein